METVCPCKTQVGTLFPMKGILLSMLKFHVIIDRGVKVGNDLERSLVIRMEVETLGISNHGWILVTL